MQSDHLDFAIDLAQKAGVIMKSHFHLGMKEGWKSDHTPITQADKKVNQLVIDAVRKYYPNYSAIAEEGSNRKESEYAWICDPIDGTIPFAHGYPTFVFVLALTRRGESILGVIYDPYMDRLVVAEKGKGAYLNDKKIHVSFASKLENTVIDVGIWKGPFEPLSSLHTRLMKRNCFPMTLRSMNYAAILVAAGELAALISSQKHPWDGAAVKIIVEEAKGKVTNVFGKNQRYDKNLKGIIASNGLLHKQLIDLVDPLLKTT